MAAALASDKEVVIFFFFGASTLRLFLHFQTQPEPCMVQQAPSENWSAGIDKEREQQGNREQSYKATRNQAERVKV